ncbi:MAG: ABC transporter ATP-binding protein [Cyanobacteriota bacterium]
MIEAIKLTKIYNAGNQEVIALNEISLKINAGEFVSVMGPSGSGKSTFMTILGCLDKPTRGQLLIDDTDISKLDEKSLSKIRNKKIGFVFQSFNLLNDMTALENVALPLFYARVKKEERMKRAKESLARVCLENRMNHTPLELSGGQQQRVSIARALVTNPALILADEPTGALDTKTSYEIMKLLDDLNKEKTTIVIITHEPDIANCTKRIIWLRDGKITKDQENESKIDDILLSMQTGQDFS